jgi:hypothetical protein
LPTPPRTTYSEGMRRVRRVLVYGFLVACLAAPAAFPCACSNTTETPRHGHCSTGDLAFRSLHGCNCACMTAQQQNSAVGRASASLKSAALITHLGPALGMSRLPAIQLHRAAIALFPSPPLAPPLVLRI